MATRRHRLIITSKFKDDGLVFIHATQDAIAKVYKINGVTDVSYSNPESTCIVFVSALYDFEEVAKEIAELDNVDAIPEAFISD